MFSVVVLVIATLYNLIMASYIMISENMLTCDFHDWIKSNTRISAVFTVIAAANVKVLTVLNSKLCKSKIFSAPFSERCLRLIYWGSLGGFFVENVPQFVILVSRINW